MSSPVINATTLPLTEWIGDPLKSGATVQHIARKVKKAVKTKNKATNKTSGKRADGLPKKPMMVRKGGRKYGHLKDGTQLSASWVMDNPLPVPEPQVSRYPDTHPLWPAFKAWVETGMVVRRDLLNFHPESKSGKDWEQVWLIFLAGAMCGASAVSQEFGLVVNP